MPVVSTPLTRTFFAANVTPCFTDAAPNGQPYTHVLDLTGETAFDRPAEIQISQTLNVSLNIAKEAAKHNVRAYFRSLHPVYDHDTEKKQYKEEDADGWKPFGTRGVWWHETMRAVGSVPNLPLVVMRVSQLYGPGMTHGEMTTTILLGLVYKQLDQQMQFLWSSKLKKNSVNTQDVVAAAWACCQWAATKTRAQLNEAAGIPLPPSGHASVESTPNAIKKEAGSVTVPVFNLTDDSDSDQGSIGETLAQVSSDTQSLVPFVLTCL
jgi:nucleoside-diphosphate-sugar epimerase